MFSTLNRFRFAAFIALWGCGILLGIATGGVMNAINGRVSPDYFSTLFQYSTSYISGPVSSPGIVSAPSIVSVPNWTLDDVHRDSFEHGVWEGVILGCIISTLFTVYVFVVSVASCPFLVAIRFLLRMLALVVVFWTLGGLNGAVIGLLFPDSWFSVPTQSSTPLDKARWLWVAGSIWGAYFGSVACLFWGCISFNRTWQKMKTSTASDNAAPE